MAARICAELSIESDICIFTYFGFTQRFNRRHFLALEQQTDILRRKTFSHDSEPWEGNNAPLQADLVQLTRQWSEFVRNVNGMIPPCPISFTKEKQQDTLAVVQSQEEIDEQMDQIRDSVGIGSDGWTSNGNYDDAVD